MFENSNHGIMINNLKTLTDNPVSQCQTYSKQYTRALETTFDKHKPNTTCMWETNNKQTEEV